MAENKRIEYIPAKPLKREKRVGIYCRVSTNSVEQLKSLGYMNASDGNLIIKDEIA